MSYCRILLLLFLCFLHHGKSTGEESTTLVLAPSTEFIRVGSSIVLSCNIFNLADDFFLQGGAVVFNRFENLNDKTNLSYFTPEQSNVTESRYRVRGGQRTDRYVVGLEMTEVVQEDEKEYQCALYRNGNFVKGSPHEQLKWIRTAPINNPTCKPYIMNEKWNFRCSSEESVPPPDLVWFRDGVEVRRKTSTFSSSANTLEVNLTDIDSAYECRYYYIGGGINDERSCRIHKPNITVVSPANTEFISGSDAKIIVLARASPPMTTAMTCEWDLDNDVKEFSVQNDGNDLAVISILDIDSTMNGSHITCCGTNLFGESCTSIFVSVKETFSKRTEPSATKNGFVILEHVAIGTLVVVVILLSIIIFFLYKRGGRRLRSSDNIPFETEIRSASFASSSAGSQNSNADSGVNLQDASCPLKRSATVPVSRRLPAPPEPLKSQFSAREGTFRNETYSIIKNDQPSNPEESNLQPYMDMGGKKKKKTSPTYSDELVPYDNTMSGDCYSSSHDNGEDREESGKERRSESSSEKVGYLEVKKDPSSQCQYQDLEDLYRETASNNLYAP